MFVLKHQIGNGKKGVWFSKVDLDLLELISELKYLSFYQIKYFYERMYGVPLGSTERKIHRWMQYKVVISTEYTKQPGSKKYYRIGPEGLKVLKAIDRIKYQDTIVLHELKGKKSYDHFFAIRDVILLSLINFKKGNHRNPSLSPGQNIDDVNTSPNLVPDWVIYNEYGFLNIEMDTGTETFSKIKEKILKYVEYAKKRPKEIHHVLFAVIEGSDSSLRFTTLFPSDRSTRIANLKEAVIYLNAHIYPNLNFYVVPISRSGEVAFKILTGAYPLSSSDSFEVNDVTTIMGVYPTLKLGIAPLKAEDFYLPEVQKELYADGHCQFNSPSMQSTETVLIKLMEEGSVRNLDQLSYLDLLQTEKRFKKSVDKILAVYSKDEELENDVLGRHFPNIYFSSLDKLIANLKSYPLFYQTLNTARKEEVRLYES